MKHKRISKASLGNHFGKVEGGLLPGTPEEKRAITQVQKMEANEEEKRIVDDYLLLNIGQGQVVGLLPSSNGRFALKTTTK